MASSNRKIRFTVSDEDAGRRLDQVLASRISDLSRRKARVLLDIGGVFVDKVRVKVASRKLRAGQVVEANLGGALERATKDVGSKARDKDAASLPSFEVVHEDTDLLVVHKPAGLLTAPTPESDRNNLADLLSRRRGRRERIMVVHRIDLQTSGLLVFARTDSANKALSALFREHDIERRYLAVVQGAFAKPRSVDSPIAGRRAVTHFAPERALGDRATLVTARLETGRTHQIRIHGAEIGHSVLGDRQYGSRTEFEPPRMALHATHLGFVHPHTNKPVAFDAPWPADLTPWLQGMDQR